MRVWRAFQGVSTSVTFSNLGSPVTGAAISHVTEYESRPPRIVLGDALINWCHRPQVVGVQIGPKSTGPNSGRAANSGTDGVRVTLHARTRA